MYIDTYVFANINGHALTHLCKYARTNVHNWYVYWSELQCYGFCRNEWNIQWLDEQGKKIFSHIRTFSSPCLCTLQRLQYNVFYASPEEYERRLAVFADNFAEVNHVNSLRLSYERE